MSTSNNPRRAFLTAVAAIGAAGVTSRAVAQAKVDEKDPQATALGYVSEATKSDAKRFPKYAAGQNSGTCVLYQGKAGDAAGNCALFAGKQVAAKG